MQNKLTLSDMYEEAQKTLIHCQNKYKLNILQGVWFKIRDVKRGNTGLYGNITIPLWLQKINWPFFYYYVFHEVTHYICEQKYHNPNHGDKFKKIEIELLNDYGYIPKYNKMYINELRNFNNEVLYID